MIRPTLKNSLFIICSLLYFAFAEPVFGQQVSVNAQSVVSYVMSCRKPNGAFGPAGQEYSDVAWTYPAVQTLQLLDAPLPDADACLPDGGKSWMEKAGWKNGPWYWSFYQKASLYALYKRNDHGEQGMHPGAAWQFTYVPRKNYSEFRDYLKGAFFDMESLWHLTAGVLALGVDIRETAPITRFLDSCWSSSGSFGNHIVNTHAAVRTLSALKLPVPDRDKCIQWLQSCQKKDGGFGWSPDDVSASNRPDVWYTWAAVMALKELGAKPAKPEACIAWLNKLQNPDGGFGDQPGWDSRLYSTYYAVEALHALSNDGTPAISAKKLSMQSANAIPEGKYRIFQAQHKTPAGGAGMVDSMMRMGFHLIGVKSREKEVVAGGGMSQTVREARAYAARKGYELEIVDCPENYAHQLTWFGGQRADHVSNFMIPPQLTDQQRSRYLSAYRAGTGNLPWTGFKAQVIGPVVSMGTLFYPELDFTLLNAYMVYDEGLYGGNGYNAVPGAHFGNIDWVRHFPYHERWVGRLPIIADGDAHGDVVAWERHLRQFRNVFLAEDNTLAAYTDASKNGRSVCVIVMPDGAVRYYGSRPAVAYLKKHLDKWRWW